MGKYIDAEKLKAEIDNIYSEAVCEYKSTKSRYSEGALDVIHRISSIITYLQQEQPEVDLVAELKHHLETTPKEQLEKEWKALEPWGKIGPTVNEFLYGRPERKFKVGDSIRHIGKTDGVEKAIVEDIRNGVPTKTIEETRGVKFATPIGKEQEPLCASGTAEPDYGICDSYVPAALQHALKRHGWYACCIEEDDEIIKERRDYVARNWPADKDALTQDKQPPEWSEEDKIRLDSIISSYRELLQDYKACHDVDYIPDTSDTLIRNVADDVDFLKSLRLQPKQKWSEEDIELLNIIISDVKRTQRNCGLGTDEWNVRSKAIRLLKSLRPQPHWKPSEEQMAVLKNAIHFYGKTVGKEVLESLYNELKELV